MKGKKDKDVYLQAITVIDPATGWIEIRSVPEARADLVANHVEIAWLPRYRLPDEIMVDKGKELLAEFSTMMANHYRITANAILERVHQPIENIIHAFTINKWI